MGEGIFRCKEHQIFSYPRPLAGRGEVNNRACETRIFEGAHEGHEEILFFLCPLGPKWFVFLRALRDLRGESVFSFWLPLCRAGFFVSFMVKAAFREIGASICHGSPV